MRAGFNRLQVRSRQAGRAFEVEANWDPGPSLTSSQHRHIRFQLTLSLLSRSLLFCFLLSFSRLMYVFVQKRTAWKLGCSNSISIFVVTSEWLMSWWIHCNHDARIILVAVIYLCVCECVRSSYFASLFGFMMCLRARLNAQRTVSPQSSDTLIYYFSFLISKIADLLTLVPCHLNRTHPIFGTAKQGSKVPYCYQL